MKKLLSTKYSAGAFNTAMLALRVGIGILMMMHGYDKLVHFSSYQNHYPNFLGIGSTLSLAMVVFAEFFCSLFIILGLFTRLASIPLIIKMCVIIFKINDGHVFLKNENAPLYLICFVVILLIGPGRVSVDSLTNK
ncbi:MAG: DoxX family protein [Ferruginibacter sp.]